MALTDTQLLTSCAEFTLHHTQEAEERVLEEFQASGATALLWPCVSTGFASDSGRWHVFHV
jgi:hypothetical protein